MGLSMTAPRMSEAMNQVISRKVYVANIMPAPLGDWPTMNRTWGSKTLRGCAPGEEFTVLEITGAKDSTDMGDNRKAEFPISADEIAFDLCKYINGDAGPDSFLGVFICAGPVPTRKELDDAKAKLDAFADRMIALADKDWQRSENSLFINDLQRFFCKYRGLERDWNSDQPSMKRCDGCGEWLRPGVAVCKSCGAILDYEKAKSLGLIQEAPVVHRRKRGPNKPKPEAQAEA